MFAMFKTMKADMAENEESQNTIQIQKKQFAIQGPRTISEKDKRRIRASNKQRRKEFVAEVELEENETATNLAIAGMLCSVALDKYNDDKNLALAYYIEATNEGSVVGAIAVAQLYIKEFNDNIKAMQYFDYACRLYKEEYQITYSEAQTSIEKSILIQVMEHVEKCIQAYENTN